MSVEIRRGSMYLADLSPRRGTEPGKRRPVVVVQTDLLNEIGHPSTVVLPCTTRLSGDNLLRTPVPNGMARNTADCEIMIDQVRAIDNRRLVRRLGALPAPIFREVREKLARLLET